MLLVETHRIKSKDVIAEAARVCRLAKDYGGVAQMVEHGESTSVGDEHASVGDSSAPASAK